MLITFVACLMDAATVFIFVLAVQRLWFKLTEAER